MSTDSHEQRLREAFQQATSIDSDRRQDWIRESFSSDPRLIEDLEKLLAGVDGLTVTTASPDAASPRRAAFENRERPDREVPAAVRYGPWEIEAVLGQGGMGTVYRARRTDAYEQVGALKLIHHFDKDRQQQRFRLERQLLADLDDPRIARLLDGGDTPGGIPYLVMELVEGERIDTFCDRHQWSVRQRVRLFCEVCRAVEVAHRSSVIHRDIKPSNVLVTPEGAPKLLDFGLAKPLLDDDAATVGSPMTPSYASPEQIRGHRVTTATDVYSLGVLLYQLVTGCNPQRLSSPSLAELVRAVCETDPPSADQLVSSLPADEAAKVAELRSTSARSLRRELAGELALVAETALAKDPEDRYASVASLRQDLESWLDGEPVLAHLQGRGYLLGKWIRKNWRSTLAGASFVLVLAASTVLISLLAFRLREQRDVALAAREDAQREARTADLVSTFLLEMISSSQYPKPRGHEITVHELLETGSAEALEELDGEPEVQAPLLAMFAKTYRRLEKLERATELTELALGRYADLGDSETARHQLALRFDLAELAGARGDYETAVSQLQEVGEEAKTLLGPESEWIGYAQFSLGELHLRHGQNDLAEAALRSAIDQLEGKNPSRQAMARAKLGALEIARGDLAPAELLLRRALTDLEGLEVVPTDLALVLSDLASIESLLGRYEESGDHFRRALELQGDVYGREHPHYLIMLGNLAVVERKSGDLEQAAHHLEEAMVGLAATFGRESFWWANLRQHRSKLSTIRGEADSEEELKDALRILEATLGPGHHLIAAALEALGHRLALDEQFEAATGILSRASDIRAALDGDRWSLDHLTCELLRAEVEIAHRGIAPSTRHLAELAERLQGLEPGPRLEALGGRLSLLQAMAARSLGEEASALAFFSDVLRRTEGSQVFLSRRDRALAQRGLGESAQATELFVELEKAGAATRFLLWPTG